VRSLTDTDGSMTDRATIAIISPVRQQISAGNNITSQRWGSLLRSAGHETFIVHVDESDTTMARTITDRLDCADVLIALHARRSSAAVAWWTVRHPERPVIVAITGTTTCQHEHRSKPPMPSLACNQQRWNDLGR
jgi:hypothetical protein